MRLFRVSVAGMMALVVFVAMAIAALRYPSGPIRGFTFLISLGLLMLAVTGVAYRRHGRRAFCLGFALFGWGYLAMSYPMWGEPSYEVDKYELVTTKILDRLRPSIELNDDNEMSWFGFEDVGAKTRRIWVELDKPLSMPFGNSVSLDEFIKYVTAATARTGQGSAIAIYVDPIGLLEAEKTMASRVKLSSEGVALRTSLKFALDQLDLKYYVRDGLLTITSKDSDGSPATRSQDGAPSFHRIGHCLISLLVGCIGGFAARRVHDTRDLD